MPASDLLPIMKAIEKERCTALIGVPTTVFDLLRHTRRHEFNLSSLQLVVFGGAPTSAALIRRTEQELNIPHVVQVYGQTESGRIATTSFVEPEKTLQRYESMGKCVPRREIKIIDVISKCLVPLGEPGEICTRSFRTMRGYWLDEGKTREVIDDAQWVHTGDLGALDEDGCIYFRGRAKDIIIRGGINIFPLEIEACLEQHALIERAQVFGITDERLGELVCAMVITKNEINVDELRRFLGSNLAYFKIPTHIHVVSEFPVTSGGKIQKFKLAEIMKQILLNEHKIA
jgi:fatty-acyl-CoA synthase